MDAASNHQMARAIDKRAFFLRVAAHKINTKRSRSSANWRITLSVKRFPAEPGVRVCLMRARTVSMVEQQHALLGPMLQIAVVRALKAGDIFGEFFINVLQLRAGICTSGAHRKRQTVCLSFVVIWVLPQHHHFHLIEFGGFEALNTSCAGG